MEEISRVTALAQHHWAEARSNSYFRAFAPWLEQIITLKREEAAAVGFAEVGEPYDALLDEYEPGASSADVAAVFDALRQEVVPLLDAIKGARNVPSRALLSQHFPAAQQAMLGREAAAAAVAPANECRVCVLSVLGLCGDMTTAAALLARGSSDGSSGTSRCVQA